MIQIAKPYLTQEEAQAAYDTILSGWLTQGPRVAEFEEKFAAYTGAKYAVAVSNCTTGLHLSMIVAGIGSGDEVICPSMSYIATANCIKYVGATPVFAEIDPSNYNLNVHDVEKKITNKTKAILLVHQIGMPADIDAFQALAERYNIMLIEDAACAAGSSYKGRKIGSHSDLVCFSLHPRKVITTGEGGIITTGNEDYMKKLKLLRQHGMSINDRERHASSTILFEDHIELGYNYRLTDIQAAVGIKQLEKLDWIVSERRSIAEQYNKAFNHIKTIRLPREEHGYFTNYQSYSVFLYPEFPLTRNELMQKLFEEGISTRRGIMTSHRETSYSSDYQGLRLPFSENASDQSIILPLYVPMSQMDVLKIIDVFLKYAGVGE